jgi:hypothetical protein
LGDFTASFAADFLAAGVFAAEDILSNKKGCWQPGLSKDLMAGLQSPDKAHLMLVAEYAIVTSKWNTVG